MAAKKVSVKRVSSKKTTAKKKSARKPATKKVGKTSKAAVAKRTTKRPVSKKKVVKKSPAKKTIGKVASGKRAGSKIAVGSSVSLKIGDNAPDFSLPDQENRVISLGDFAGKQFVVLYFYPRAMTPGCTVQACGIRDTAEAFRQANAVVLGVSPDKPAALAKFRERDRLNFDLLSDADSSLAKRYGVWGPKKFMGREFMGVRRWTFIIDKQGKIRHIMDQVNTQTHHDDVLAILKTL